MAYERIAFCESVPSDSCTELSELTHSTFKLVPFLVCLKSFSFMVVGYNGERGHVLAPPSALETLL